MKSAPCAFATGSHSSPDARGSLMLAIGGCGCYGSAIPLPGGRTRTGLTGAATEANCMAVFGRTGRRAAVLVGTLALAGAGLVVLSAPAGATTVTDEATFRAA